MNIKTKYINPPIPHRGHDWVAWVDGDEEGEAGWGTTEAAAIAELNEIIKEKEPFHTLTHAFSFRDPCVKDQESFRVVFNNKVCSPDFNSKGSADCYLAELKAGRKPEYSK